MCNDSTPLNENLLGDDLEKQIKTLDEMRKVGKDLTKKKGGGKKGNIRVKTHMRDHINTQSTITVLLVCHIQDINLETDCLF